MLSTSTQAAHEASPMLSPAVADLNEALAAFLAQGSHSPFLVGTSTTRFNQSWYNLCKFRIEGFSEFDNHIFPD